ncbi:hypothetical protein TeGR_g4034, partial [Tetraparma gracilis]
TPAPSLLQTGYQPQQLMMNTYSSANSAAAAAQGGDGEEVDRMKRELEATKAEFERKMQSMAEDKEREVQELLSFKEMASAHLRAQNLTTIKRLSSSGPGAAKSIMERLPEALLRPTTTSPAKNKQLTKAQGTLPAPPNSTEGEGERRAVRFGCDKFVKASTPNLFSCGSGAPLSGRTNG